MKYIIKGQKVLPNKKGCSQEQPFYILMIMNHRTINDFLFFGPAAGLLTCNTYTPPPR